MYRITTFASFGLLLALLLLGSSATLQAQQLDFVPGDVLISLPHGESPQHIAAAYQFFEGKPTALRPAERISRPMNIWRFTFDMATVHAEHFVQVLHRSPYTEMAQLNHIIEQRVIPNDPLFPSQWQYVNDGSSGGALDADLDITTAWDVTTGGLTALGQEIVVAVIDDGIDPNHSDFGDNLWVNTAEIPNNGIDDDNNGYVDDYNGWDADNGNDNVYWNGSHGTPVAGIIGAQGNNGIGVAGVNWDVKLMIIQGGGNEAQALAAYSYAYVHRERYNQSGGAEGAFVVATNASWGINFGQPADAPLWCAFYDTLGQQGVLNCGATINGNQDVDVVGDLPTACSSDFLISVTNLDITDNKVTQAGYGATTIDLGAYGEGTYTTALGNSYGGFGGTSGATPHVTGAVALLYGAPCPSIAALAQSDPSQTALLMKSFILNGVTPNASLQGITVTGGRLNIDSSMQLLVANCSAADCLPPYALTTSGITTTDATLSWSAIDSVTSVDLRYRTTGDTIWNDVPGLVGTSYVLVGLQPCTTYEYQLSASCDTLTTDYSTTATFTTDGCCDAPASPTVSMVGDSTLTLTWEPVTAATGYEVRYRLTGSTTWTDEITLDTFVLLDSLMACASYDLDVRTLCGNMSTAYTSPVTANTTGCGACIDLAYCESKGEETFYEWLDEVVIGSYTNASGNDDGYAAFLDGGIDLEIGVPVSYVVAPDFLISPYDEYVRIWVDMDHSGTFEPSEEVAALDAISTATSGTLIIPEGALTGVTRMRIAMKYDGVPTPCETFDYGEVEDYCVNLIPAAVVPTCDPVASTAIVDSTATSLTLYTGATTDTSIVQIAYRMSGTSDTWSLDTATTDHHALLGLMPCTAYDMELRRMCDGDLLSDPVLMLGVSTVCSATSTTTLTDEVAVRALPNPFGASLTIGLELPIATPLEVTLTSISGVVVYRQQYNDMVGNPSLVIEPEGHLTAGVYFLSVRTGYSNHVLKVVKR